MKSKKLVPSKSKGMMLKCKAALRVVILGMRRCKFQVEKLL